MATAEQNQQALQIFMEIKENPEHYIKLDEPNSINLVKALIEATDLTGEYIHQMLPITFIAENRKSEIDNLIKSKNTKINLSPMAYALMNIGEDELALKIYRKIHNEQKIKTIDKSWLAILEAKSGNWDKSYNLTQELTTENKNYIWMHASYGLIGLLQGKDINFFESMLDKSFPSDRLTPRMYKSLLMALKEDINHAITDIENAYKTSCDYKGWLDLIAWYFLWSGNHETALELMQHERKLKREYPENYINYTLTLSICNLESKARNTLSKITAHPEKPHRIGYLDYKGANTTIKELKQKMDSKDGLLKLIDRTRYTKLNTIQD